MNLKSKWQSKCTDSRNISENDDWTFLKPAEREHWYTTGKTIPPFNNQVSTYKKLFCEHCGIWEDEKNMKPSFKVLKVWWQKKKMHV